MQFICSAKVRASIDEAFVEYDLDDRFAWLVHEIRINRRSAVIFVHKKTQLSLLAYGTKQKDMKRIDKLLEEAILSLLSEYGTRKEVLDRYFKDGEIHQLHVLKKSRDMDILSALSIGYELRSNFFDFENAPKDLITYFNHVRSLNNRPFLDFVGLLTKHYGAPIDYEAYVLDVKLVDRIPCRRSVQVPSFITFEVLHHVIQALYGWTDSHLHQFSLDDEKGYRDVIEMVEELDDLDLTWIKSVQSESNVQLNEFIKPGHKIDYVYDFGRSWMCEIHVLERREHIKDIQAKCLEIVGVVTLEDERILDVVGDSNFQDPYMVSVRRLERNNSDMRTINFRLEGIPFVMRTTNRR